MALSTRMLSFIADTLALVIFFTIVSGSNEHFVAGMPWNKVLVSRSIGAVLMVLTARLYGLWRDWVFSRAKPQSRWAELLTDCVALLLFQVPIYMAILAVSGADLNAIVKGTLGFALLMFVMGRPYGIFLDFVRRLFGLQGPGEKPMSLGG